MIPSIYVQKVRKEDHARSFAVRVWRLEDWLDPYQNAKPFEEIKPTLEFPCVDRADCERLIDRLQAISAVLDETSHARSLRASG